MLLKKAAFEVHSHSSQDDPRYALNGILVESDGSTVATDGHRLLKYTPADKMDDSEFPKTEGISGNSDADLEPFILPSDACKEIIKAVPKRCNLPILEYVALDVEQTNANGHAVLAVNDLENPRVFRPTKKEGAFPKYQAVIPEKDKAVATVTLDARYLKSLSETLLKMRGPGKDPLNVTISCYADKDGGALPIRFDSKVGDNGSVVAVIMPRRAD